MRAAGGRPRRSPLPPVLLLAVLVGGCSGATSPAPSPPDPQAEPAPAAPAGELRQSRRDGLRRVLQVTLRPQSPLDVTSLRLAADGFSPGGPGAGAALPAGSRVDLPVPYGAARCDAPPGAARAVLVLAGGRELVVPLADRGLVARLHAAECADRALAAQVALDVDPVLTAGVVEGRPSLRVVLRLTRRSPGDPVAVTGLGGHVVFTVRSPATGTPLVELAPDAVSATLPLELVASRCDAHALAENKRAGLLGVYVAVADGPPRLVTVTPAPAVRDRLARFAVDGCRATP